jgi:hypothetical protein
MALDMAHIGLVLERIKTPLTLAGLALLVFYGVVTQLLKMNIFGQLQASSSAVLLTHVLDYTFVLALVALILGVVSFLVTQFIKPKNP